MKLKIYEDCVMYKHYRQTFGVILIKSKELLEYVHIEMWKLSPKISFYKKLQYVFFIDDCLRYVWIYSFTQIYDDLKLGKIKLDSD